MYIDLPVIAICLSILSLALSHLAIIRVLASEKATHTIYEPPKEKPIEPLTTFTGNDEYEEISNKALEKMILKGFE